MRIEVATAIVLGVLLPLLETCRRGIGHWLVNASTMLEDYVAGALLLIAAWAAIRARSWASSFLILAWAYVAGMMGGSFWYQLEITLRGQGTLEPHNMLVVLIKSFLWGSSVISLILSFRRASEVRVTHR